MPKVSVLVPAYNCEAYLPKAVESALAQTFKDFEVIIIDDGSVDRTPSIADEYARKYPDLIRVIHQQNKGLVGARNRGIASARGEYLALLDADDIWLPDRLAEEVPVIESDRSIGLVHANITRIDEKGNVIDTPVRDPAVLSGAIFEHILLRHAHVSCPTALFRKECCDRVGAFDENFNRLGCEDRDLWLRISLQYRAVYIDKVLAFYRMHPASMSQNMEKMLKARLGIVEKFCPPGKNTRLRSLALGNIYRDGGDDFLLRGDFENAKKQYILSLKHAPGSFWAWLNLFKAALRLKVKEG